MDNKGNIQKPPAETDKKNQLYPVFLKLEQLELLLVGGRKCGAGKTTFITCKFSRSKNFNCSTAGERMK
jgi:hypothetical protein